MRWQAARTVAWGGSVSRTWSRIRAATGLVNMTPSYSRCAWHRVQGWPFADVPGPLAGCRWRLRRIGMELGVVPASQDETIVGLKWGWARGHASDRRSGSTRFHRRLLAGEGT